MGKYDKDRFQKELAVRYCIARGMIPFLEVAVRSASDLSDSTEVITDLDVVGVEAVSDGGLRRTIFDCKSSGKMSSVNRAFWAAGIKAYTACDDAHVILKSRAVNNHRLSALSLNVDLHDEESFKALGKTIDVAFPADDCYQASIERWNSLYGCYENNKWTATTFDLVRNQVPLSQAPWSTFRKILAELRKVRGEFDPNKDVHLAIYFEVLASCFVLWAVMGRDIRRFFEPTMKREEFEKVLRYYLWGGKESFEMRQQLRAKAVETKNIDVALELPAWTKLLSFVGLIVNAPQRIFECAFACREISLRLASQPNVDFDQNLQDRLKENSRIRQFSSALNDYLAEAGGLPKDLSRRVDTLLFNV
jgi:hypothetical protein